MNSAIFQYPKSKHIRSLNPPIFKRYRTYKRYLQHEFLRVCVYCRQPDSSAPNLNFGVDHYRPKGIAKFAGLVCDYSNLYYCCGNCNSRKNNYWPTDEKLGPYVVNPCDHVMSQHLKFEAGSGKMLTCSKSGEYTEELLQLNDQPLIEFRKTTLHALKIAKNVLALLISNRAELFDLLKSNKISSDDYESALADIELEIDITESHIQNLTGTKPPIPLKKSIYGVVLSKT